MANEKRNEKKKKMMMMVGGAGGRKWEESQGCWNQLSTSALRLFHVKIIDSSVNWLCFLLYDVIITLRDVIILIIFVGFTDLAV